MNIPHSARNVQLKCTTSPEKGVLQIEEVAGLGASLVNLSNDTDIIALPRPRKCY